MTTAIVGGGIMGVTLGYCLAKAGVPVTIYEASATLGGLAGPLTLPDGVEVDRFYHAVLQSDDHLLSLCDELGLADRLRFSPTGSAVYAAGQTHPMNGVADFLRLPLLNPLERLRLGLTIVAAQRVRRWQDLESVPIREWLVRTGGDGVFRKFWGPMLHAKFDGDVGETPATWMWSRVVRTRSTRRGARQREQCGHLVGGYRTLLDAMAHDIRARGGAIHLSTPIQRVVIADGRVRGIETGGATVAHDAAVVTMQAPIAARLTPGAPEAFLQALRAQRYLGIVCPLFVLDRPLTGVWTLNVADADALVTGVIETTSFIDPALVGGHHLVYAPKYVHQQSRWLDAPDAEVVDAWRQALARIAPGFARATVRHALVHRERFVEPLHVVNGPGPLPFDTPVTGLHLVTTAQIYPALTNGESVTRHARDAAAHIAAGARA